MTRKRAEKLLTAAVCGRGRYARNFIADAKKTYPGKSNAQLLTISISVLAKATTETLIIILLDEAALKQERDGWDPSRWEAAMRSIVRQKKQFIAIAERTEALGNLILGGGA